MVMKKRFAILISLLLVFALTGCSEFIERLDDTDIRSDTEAMLDAIIAQDKDTAYALVSDACTESEFLTVYTQLYNLLGDTETYELTAVKYNSSVDNGVKTQIITYKMVATLNADKDLIYYIEAGRMEGVNGLASFYVSSEEDMDPFAGEHTGTLGNMEGADIFQWALLLLSGVMIVFVIIVFVDCCRRKIKSKALWLIAILLGIFSFTVSAADQSLDINLQLGFLISQSALMRYANGNFVFRLLIPIGAIVYWYMRKSITIKPETEQPQNSPAFEEADLIDPQDDISEPESEAPEPESEAADDINDDTFAK